MSIEENKALVREVVERVYSGEVERIDEVAAPDYMDHSHWKNRDGLRKMLRELEKAYPGLRFVVEDLIAEGDRVAARIRCNCRTHPGDGHDKVIHLTTSYRIQDGKLAEHWGHSDSLL